MNQENIQAVTGAFGYSGKYITHRLLAEGREVVALTDSINRQNPFQNRVPAVSFNFHNPGKLAESLRGVSVLYNTYWVRFNHPDFTYAQAVQNTRILFEAAKAAGVKRIVHISITNPSEDSFLEYFRSKAHLERMLRESGISYAIIRPTVLFGKEDILINNIAWALRRFPLFCIFGKGDYKLQPIYVDDLAQLAVQQGKTEDNTIINAIGPETFTYYDLIRIIGEIIGKPRPILRIPPSLGAVIGWAIGKLKNDVLITRDEIIGLMSNLLYIETPPTGETKLTDWAKSHAAVLGLHYTSELARRLDRVSEYKDKGPD